jgi:hypothetical protein
LDVLDDQKCFFLNKKLEMKYNILVLND